MFKSDILFTGYYGHKNTGDDAFVEVAQWGAEKIWNKNKIRFLAKNESLPITINPSEGYPFSIPKTYSIQSNLLLNNTDYLISAGGSTLIGPIAQNNPKAIAQRRKSNGKNIKIGAIGVSVGPFASAKDEKAVTEYLKNLDFLALRDQYSYDYVSNLNLPCQAINSFDLAALLPEIYNFSRDQIKGTPKTKTKTVGVSLCPYESIKGGLNLATEKKRNEDMLLLLQEIDQTENVHFKFYIINGHPLVGDAKLTMETISTLAPKSYEIVQYSRNTKDIWHSIANCDFVISTRLHAAIFACFANTPFMLNEYHRKCADFLNNVGYQEQYRLYNSEYDPIEKSKQIIEILNHKSTYRVPSKVEEMKGLARLNFTGIQL